MRRSHSARLAAGLFIAALMFTFSPNPLGAQAPQTRTFPASLGYDKAHEITLDGTVQQVVSNRVPGSPAGLHLLVTATQDVVDVHLGPYLAKDTQNALHAGTPVQIVGAMQNIHGKEYLLARQLIFSGRLVTVRSENGFLLRVFGSRMARSVPESQTVKATTVTNGGTR